MTIRSTPEMAVSRQRGADTGVVLTLASPEASLFIGQIAVNPDTTQSAVVGEIRIGSSTVPGRVVLRAEQTRFNELLALARQSQKLVVSLSYDDATMRVESIECRPQAS